MQSEPFTYLPPSELVKRVRLFFVRTAWHASIMEAMWQEATQILRTLSFSLERVHLLEGAGAFELVHLAGAIARQYTWRYGFSQLVSVRGPTHIQSNLRLPPFFQGNLDSQLRSEFLLESPGPIGYFQPFEPQAEQELPAIIVLGCILRGATKHNEYLAHAVIANLAYLNLLTGIPIILGILTPDTLQQAWERVSQVREWVLTAFMTWEARLKISHLRSQLLQSPEKSS
ncbi:MAG: 6,7-dimethyl-8-ribityllumazine synthase [Bacteroidia bacterium]|nr:6,7-dimethyl-8-ribityllumazine synthase [Bacteroidia bacterium]MDW8133995.1 6,7-dimethyl-8-ribityllumazine synthase [Bacteroidia bacterium]